MTKIVHFQPCSNEGFYILGADRRPVRATQQEWEALSPEKRLVAESLLEDGKVIVRTSFSGLDLDCASHYPQLFETLSIIGDEGCDEGRWRSWEEAEEGHAATVLRFERLLERGNVLPFRR